MPFIIPGVGEQVESDVDHIQQSIALLSTYSPRLFGSPPQLTSLNDIRSMSASSGSDGVAREGAVGDFYLNDVLRDAQVANFVVGRAMFTGGMSSFANAIRVVAQYNHALSKYGDSNTSITGGGSAKSQSELMQMYQDALVNDDGKYETAKASTVGGLRLDDLDEDTTVLNDSSISSIINDTLGGAFGGNLAAPLLTSLSVQQPFYTFDSDWNSYINNVKMMINAAITMLGLNDASVRIGDELVSVTEKDVWSRYRFITSDVSDANTQDSQNGDTNQYVSFMIDPKSISESYSNSAGDSMLYSSVINAGSSFGQEIAFITSSSQNAVDDLVVNLAGDAINAAEKVMTALSGGVGRFTAALASSMSRSFIGDRTVYPMIFQGHTSNSSAISMTIKLRASGGDPYSYFTEILVPMFFALGMVLPQMSKNSAAAYTYPPLVQVNIPGMWGTRLGLVTDLTIVKNPEGNDISVYGYPLSVDLTLSVTDLQHTLMTSPMNRMSTMLNNHSMFDYIAQCCGVDKYRPNGSMRIITKAILASQVTENFSSYLGDALTSDFWSAANRFLGTSRF